MSVQITKVFQGVSEGRDMRKGICRRIFSPRYILSFLIFDFFRVIKNKANTFLISYNFEMPAK